MSDIKATIVGHRAGKDDQVLFSFCHPMPEESIQETLIFIRDLHKDDTKYDSIEIVRIDN